MADVPGTMVIKDDGSLEIAWYGLEDEDVGLPVEAPYWPKKSIQMIGDGTSVLVEGSNDGATWDTLTDGNGNALTALGEGEISNIGENTKQVRVTVTGGVDNTIIIIAAIGQVIL